MLATGYLHGAPRFRPGVGQRVLPAMIDAAGGVEAVLEALAERTRRRPATVLGLAAGTGFLLSTLLVSCRRGT
jgi:hypothetical protein